MPRQTDPIPTETELLYLRILWARGICTIRDVHDEVTRTKQVSYASVDKIVGQLVSKGWVTVTDERRPQRVAAAVSQDEMLSRIAGSLKRSIFGNSLAEMMRHLIRNTSKSEIDQARRIVDEAADRSKPRK